MINVSQLATINGDFAQYWSDICELPIALIAAIVKQAQREGFSSGDSGAAPVDDDACITTLANVFYRTVYYEGTSPS